VTKYNCLHTHTHYSLLDGVGTPEEYMMRAKAIGMEALAITDHGTLAGHREFVRTAKEHGIKPILGVEAYFCNDVNDKRLRKDRDDPLDPLYFHLVILAKNDKGLENLSRMMQVAWTDAFTTKPRIDFEMLDKYKEGLIITSGCMSGTLNKCIEEDNWAKAKEYLSWFTDRFGDDFYIEVMPHNIAGMNENLLKLADDNGVKAVVTADCHHATIDQKVIQEAMLLLNTHAKVHKDSNYNDSLDHHDLMDRFDYLYGADRKMSFRSFDIHLLSGDEMWEAMKADGVEREDIFDNTAEIAEKVEDYTIPENLNLLPAQYKDPDAELRSLAEAGLKKRGIDGEEYSQRLEEELKIIADKQFAPYFLVVKNMLLWAKKQGIMVGPGRGSSAGSLVCYALGITDVDPIEHGLLFFRFIDPSRDDWPDIDSDIQDNRREEVKDYLVRQYRHVASIATFQKFKDKGVVRDAARVLNVPLSDVNKVLKQIDTWDEFIKFSSTREFRENYPEVVEIASQLRGRIRGTGIHAAGVVTSKEPIAKVAPMETRNQPGSKVRTPVVGFDMDEAARVGLIKIDALGLKALSVISDTLDTIADRGKPVKVEDIPMDDPAVYRMLSQGNTKGVFQCEAAPYTMLLQKMGVHNFTDLAASNALVRPGAMNTIGKEFIDRKQGRSMITYLHPVMKDFTEETYGEIIYQEQVMLACVNLGGMTMQEANKVRKIIGKKKDPKEFEAYRKKFVDGASKLVSKEDAEQLWKHFEAHAGYSFNKSHAVAYSILSYWTAWLKLYYPLEFMVSVLRNEKDVDTLTEYLIECKRLGIPMKLPHINESDIEFKIEGDGIRFGLNSVKYVSDKLAARFIEHRPYPDYKSVEEKVLAKGTGLNTRALASLRAIGAVNFVDNTMSEKEIRENLYEYLGLPEFSYNIPSHYHSFITTADEYEERGAFILLGLARNVKRGKGWSRVEILDKTGVAGVFDDQESCVDTGKTYLYLIADNRILSAIPADKFADTSHSVIKFLNYKTLPYGQDEQFVVAFRKRVTKAGKKMGSVIVADHERKLEAITVFPSNYGDAYIKLREGEVRRIHTGKTKDGQLTYKGIL
jgi:DNA polymerase-3 subunit alpha